MSVYDFLKRFEFDDFYITCDGRDITCGDAVKFEDICRHYEEREAVLDALECTVVTVDFIELRIFCETY